MASNKKVIHLTRKKLDEKLSQPQIRDAKVPAQGWIKTIRRCLGISQVQLASRMHITNQTLNRLEKSELRGSIELNSLQRAANAMNCRLLYFFVPITSLDSFLRQHAQAFAEKIVAEVETHMNLEGQGSDKKIQNDRIHELTEQFVEQLDKRVWQNDE